MSELLSWEEEKRRAQDPLTSDLVKEFERQIRKYGKIQQYGLGGFLFSEGTHLSETSQDAPRMQAKDNRQKDSSAHHRDRENDPDGDGEPEG